MEIFGVFKNGNFIDSLNNLNILATKKAKEAVLKLKNDENKQISDAIAFKNSQGSIIDRIKADAGGVKSNIPSISSSIKSALSIKSNGISTVQSSQAINQSNQSIPLKVDIEAAQRVVNERKSAVLNAVSRLTPFRQQVFSTIVSKAKRDYGQNEITKDLSAFQQVRGLYSIGDFSLEEYDNFYNIAASVMDLSNSDKGSYFIDLVGKAAKRQGAGMTLAMVNSIMNIALTSRPVGFKSPVKDVGTEPAIRRVDVQKILEQNVSSFYEKITFKAKPIGGGKFGIVVTDGERKATIFQIAASDQREYRKLVEQRYLEQLGVKLRSSIKPILSSSAKRIKDLDRLKSENKREKL